MKTFEKLSILFLLISLFACKSQESTTVVYKVNSAKTDCVGVGPMTCLQIQKGENIDSENWELFYSSIEGFEYEPGYIYSISVKETQLKEIEVPADGSSIKFELIEILEKTQDPLLSLHDIYVVKEILGTAIQGDSLTKPPTMEISVSERRIAGTDGCNNYFASIEKLTETEISFSPIGATQMMCPDMNVPDSFTKALSEVKTYSQGNGLVKLMNANGESILLLKKID